jgi:hypothetical protein
MPPSPVRECLVACLFVLAPIKDKIRMDVIEQRKKWDKKRGKLDPTRTPYTQSHLGKSEGP